MTQDPSHSLPTTLYLASGNAHKAQEFATLFETTGLPVVVHPATAIGGMPEVDENAPDFAGNALLKARALRLQIPEGAGVLSDDSGLAVDALNGAPGVRSARYAGPGATDEKNRIKLLQELKGIPAAARHAAFHCVLALIDGSGTEYLFEGRSPGRILEAVRGEAGFGYDPLFVPEGDSRSYAEMTMEEKNRTSHRSRAFQKLLEWWKVQ